jgi:hypothetical protein
VKRIFIGNDRLALQVFAPKSEHVNYHPNTLHLWAPLSGERPIPDFRKDGVV